MTAEVEALSVRKLVLETGKFNVLTAQSFRVGLELFHLFPNIFAAVIVTDLNGAMAAQLKHRRNPQPTTAFQ